MKKAVALLLLLGCIPVGAQTYTKNFTKSYEPKIAFSVSEITAVIEALYTTPSILTLNDPVTSGTYEARESIILSDGFQAAGDVRIQIRSPESAAPHPDLLQHITYTDGLDRPTQSIAQAQSPQGYDMVAFTTYDPYGREAVTYLPYPTTQYTGEMVADPLVAQQDYYVATYGDGFAKSEKLFDGSPLNRVTEVSSPGSDWQIISNSNESHTRKMEYGTNSPSGDIYQFSIDDSDSIPVVHVNHYEPGELFKNIVKNEHWQPSDGKLNTVETYTDKKGRTLAKIVFEAVSGDIQKRITQNVYDRHGRLRYILPPKAVAKADTLQNLYTIDTNLVYQYQYDTYNRQIAQRVPGRQWEYTVYDALDRPILTQDANLAAKGQWLFAKYDAFGRPVYSGTYTSTKSRDELQAEVDTYSNSHPGNPANVEKRTPGTTTVGGAAFNYTNNAFPVSDISEVLSIHYYDDYTFTDDDKPVTPTTVQEQMVTTRTRSLPTAHFTKTIGQATWSKRYTYYDEKGREIKIYHKNHLGGYTTTESRLDFRGKTDLTITQHKRTGSGSVLTIQDRFTYDAAERSLGHFQKINNQAEERIAENEYDELGMLIKKKVGSSKSKPLQTVDYAYNIRGWLTKINNLPNYNNSGIPLTNPPIHTTYIDEDGIIICAAPQSNPFGNFLKRVDEDYDVSVGGDLFALTINYNTTAAGASPAPARYDGGISQIIWKSAHDNTARSYAYQYDALNRLSASHYQFNNDLNGNTAAHFNTQYSYDAQGNLATLTRNGTGSIIDQLTYTYGTSNGNQLFSVSDSGSSGGFTDGNTSGDDYAYDGNGNMVKDLNKGITYITYNHLDLVETVTLPNNRSVTFQYDAGGTKLQKHYKNGSTSLKRVEYLGGFQYTNGKLEFFPTPEGYVYRSGSTYKYMYLYTDHLGNTRLSYTDANGNGTIGRREIASNTNYYPFGSIHSGHYVNSLAAGYKYTFQGKEFQDESGLNWHDFGSRMYDPLLGRWMATDPQNQFGSPYQAMGNNPVFMVDPDGEFVHIIVGAIIGGAINLAANWNNIDNVWEGLSAFGAGAAAGAATAACGGCSALVSAAVAVGGGSTVSATNNVITQTGNGVGFGDVNWGSVGVSAAVGGVSGLAGYGAGQWAVKNLSAPLVNELGLSSQSMFSTGINGTVGGAVGGYAGSFTGGFLMSGGNVATALDSGIKGIATGAVVGAGTGLGMGYINAKQNNLNPITGRPLKGVGVAEGASLPKGWIQQTSKKGGGTVFKDPKNPHNIIRQMPGNPNSPNPAQRSPYIKFMKNGNFYDVNGNPLLNGNIPEAHIPLNQFDINKMPKL